MAEKDIVRSALLENRSRSLVQIIDEFSHVIDTGVYEVYGQLVMRCHSAIVRALYEEGVVLGQPYLSAGRTYIHRQPTLVEG